MPDISMIRDLLNGKAGWGTLVLLIAMLAWIGRGWAESGHDISNQVDEVKMDVRDLDRRVDSIDDSVDQVDRRADSLRRDVRAILWMVCRDGAPEHRRCETVQTR